MKYSNVDTESKLSARGCFMWEKRPSSTSHLGDRFLPKLLIVWTYPATYFIRTVRALSTRREVFVYFSAGLNPDYELSLSELSGIATVVPSKGDLWYLIRTARFMEVLICGWSHPEALLVALYFRFRARVVLYLDTNLRDSYRQRIRRGLFRLVGKTFFEYVTFPGARSRRFAQAIGYSEAKSISGALFIDRMDLQARHSTTTPFIFLGRDTHEKGIEVLLEAYALYRQSVSAPRELLICAKQQSERPAARGVVWKGYVPSEHVPGMLAGGYALVLPSRFEPWGAACLEAAAAGLPLLLSTEVGAAEDLLCGNGFLFQPTVSDLLAALHRSHLLSASEWTALSDNSLAVAEKFSGGPWLDRIVTRDSNQGNQ